MGDFIQRPTFGNVDLAVSGSSVGGFTPGLLPVTKADGYLGEDTSLRYFTATGDLVVAGVADGGKKLTVSGSAGFTGAVQADSSLFLGSGSIAAANVAVGFLVVPASSGAFTSTHTGVGNRAVLIGIAPDKAGQPAMYWDVGGTVYSGSLKTG